MARSGRSLILLTILLFLIVSFSFVYANKPNISFSFVPSAPAVNQDVNFTVTDTNNTIPNLSQVLWQFPDGNVNFSRTNVSNPFFYDFNANNYTQAPAWTVTEGTFSAASGKLVGTSADAIIKNSFDYNGTAFNLHFDVNFTANASRTLIGGTIGGLGPDSPLNFNGYMVEFPNANSVKLQLVSNGTVSTLFTNVHQFVTNTGYSIDLNRTGNGTFTIAIDGNTGGYSATETSFLDMNELGAQSTGNGFTWDNFILTVPGTNVETTVVHKLLTSGTNNVCVTVKDINTLSTTTCQNITVAGDANMHILDENTLIPLIGANVTLNGTALTQTGDGSLAFDQNQLIGINTVIASFPGKTTRTWIFWADQFSTFDYNFVLLDTNKGSNIAFVIRDVNGLAYPDANVVITLKKPPAAIQHGDYNVFSGFTDSTGMLTTFLNPNPANDGNYVFFVNKTGYVPLRYDDSVVTVTVPLDEATLMPLTPYSVTVGGLGSGGVSNTSTNTLIRILSNTASSYIFTIDGNSQYYSRNYAVTTLGGKDFNLQPFLAQQASSTIIAFTVKQLSLPTLPIPDVVVQLKKVINGTTQILESAQTDASGTITFSMINGDSYFLNFFYNGNPICSFPTSDPCNATVNTTYTQYTVLIDVNGSIDSNQTQMSLFVTFNPQASSITSCLNCQVLLSQTVQSLFGKIVTVQVVRSDGSVLSNVTRSYTVTYVYDIFNETIDSNQISNTQWITVTVNVQGQNDENQSISTTYTINQTNSFLVNLRNVKNDVGEVPLLILSILITILLTGSLGIFFRDSGMTVLMSALVLAFFTFGLGWVPILGWVLAVLSGFGAYFWYERIGV